MIRAIFRVIAMVCVVLGMYALSIAEWKDAIWMFIIAIVIDFGAEEAK